MAIDAYAICPGGTGKKIKFCCPDLLPELEKMGRMLDGQQFQACCQHLDRLMEQGQRRACLMAMKAEMLRATNQLEAGEAHTAEFLERFPDSPVAWAESAMLTALGRSGREAVPKLQRAIALSDKQLHTTVYDAISLLPEVLVQEGDWAAARALWRLQAALAPDDPLPIRKMMSLGHSTEIPLLMKDEPAIKPCPAGVSWQARFDLVSDALARARWQETAERLAALAQDVPDAPVVWHNLAIVRGWLADDDGAIEAWRKFASLAAELEDAVEAEALAMLLSEDPLGDAVDLVRLSWPLQDAERLQEALLSDRRFVQISLDPAAMAGEDSPPPRLVGMLLDRPLPQTADNLSIEVMPQILGHALLYGRQTDRQARLEVQSLMAWDVEPVKALLRELGPGNLESEAEQQIAGRTSGSHQLLLARWCAPRGGSRQQVDALAGQYQRQALAERWPDQPLGVLDGRTPRQAAADPAAKVRVLATLMVVEHWCERWVEAPNLNELRTRLGLPTLEPIELAPGEIDWLPLVRLARVRVENLSDDDLLAGFHRAVAMQALKALRKLARAVADRPGFAGRPERLDALGTLARSAENIEEALSSIEEGRRVAIAAGKSCAPWDMLEVPFRFGRGQPAEAVRLVQHLQQRHIQEPGVAQALTQLLVELGLLHPDGTPVARPDAAAPLAAGPMADQRPADEPGRLWTPDSGAAPGGGGKLWTPGS